MRGIMQTDVKLTGTDLKLIKGQLVDLTPATNIPDGEDRYYAQPTYLNSWGSSSILLDRGDVEVCAALSDQFDKKYPDVARWRQECQSTAQASA